MSFGLSTIRRDEFQTVAVLLHSSLVAWYESKLRQGARFGESPEPFVIFPEVYEALDPGQAIAARDEENGKIIGVCFVHPRETHIAVGIVATAPEAAGRGVARAMMQEVLDRAESASLPVRLVSSLLSLDSYSLYTRMGFVPQTIFQDLLITVSAEGMTVPAPPGLDRVRLARPDEAPRLANYEHSLQGICREQDYAFFLGNNVGQWAVWVSEDSAGKIDGILVASLNVASPMLGPGIIGDETTALALIWNALQHLPGKTYILLAPATASNLVQTFYAWGARNVELHVSQVRGDSPAGRGLVFPTFLPETA